MALGDEEFTDEALGVDTATVDVEEAAQDVEEDAAEAEELILGKFKSQEDLTKAYQELERQFTQDRQQPQEQAPQEPEIDPFQGIPGVPDSFWQWTATVTPQAALEYVQQNQGRFGFQAPMVQNAIYQAWHGQDPMSAQRWIVDEAVNRQVSERMASLAPIEEQATEQTMGVAVWRAEQELPGFDQYRDRINEYLQSHNADGRLEQFLAVNRKPDHAFDLIRQAYYALVGQDQVAVMLAQAAQETEAPAQKRTPTQGRRNSAARPAPDAVDDLFPPGTFVDRAKEAS